MSSETLPISPALFAEAIKDLSAPSLHLKTLELRNSLAHLAYSNAQLRPFADGTETSRDGTPGQPDPDCADAMRENEVVMARMRARIALVRAEVEARGLSWTEFEAKDELEDEDEDEPGVGAAAAAATPNGSGGGGGGSEPLSDGVVNGHGAAAAGDGAARDTTGAASSSGSNPWTDGTFQTGVIRNGEVVMDSVPGQRTGQGVTTTSTSTTTEGAAAAPGQGRNLLSDAELERLLALRMAEDADDDEEGGLHL